MSSGASGCPKEGSKTLSCEAQSQLSLSLYRMAAKIFREKLMQFPIWSLVPTI